MWDERLLSQKLHKDILVFLIIILFTITDYCKAKILEGQCELLVLLVGKDESIIPICVFLIIVFVVYIFRSFKRFNQIRKFVGFQDSCNCFRILGLHSKQDGSNIDFVDFLINLTRAKFIF